MSQLSQFDKETDEIFSRVSAHTEWLPHPIANYVPEPNCKQSWRRAGLAFLKRISISVKPVVKQRFTESLPEQLCLSTPIQGRGNIGAVRRIHRRNRQLWPWRYCYQEAGSEHKPVADDDGECMVLAVNEGEIRLTGPIGRVLNLLVN